MSEHQQLTFSEHDYNEKEKMVDTDEEIASHEDEVNAVCADEESDIQAKRGKHPTEVRSELDEEIVEEEICEASKCESVSGALYMIDTYDREANAKAESSYAKWGNYAEGFENKPGKRIPKAGFHGEAGYGRARAECSMFEAEAKGPNASIGAEAKGLKVKAMAGAELASVSARAGPVDVKLGLGVDTGVSASPSGVEFKLLGTGFSFGSKMGLSFLGSEISFSFL